MTFLSLKFNLEPFCLFTNCVLLRREHKSILYTANVYRDLRGLFGEIGVRGFQNCRVYMLSVFPINSVGVPFMDFAGKL